MAKLIIEPKSGQSIEVNKGQILRVEDVDGQQVADMVCFSLNDHNERFSQSKTRVHNWKGHITTGDILYSNRTNAMFTIVEDTVGVNDLLFPPCHSAVYEKFLGIGPRNGCQENLAIALDSYGISLDAIPDPLNIFMNTGMDEKLELTLEAAPSSAGDHLDMRAEMDCLVAVTACADDQTECNGGKCTRISLEILP